MPDRVRITDVAPRDGLQNEPGVVGARDKARLIALLCAAGVDEVEATSFVSPKWVPQLGDAEDVLRLVRALLPPPTGEGRVGGLSPPPTGEGRVGGSSESQHRARAADWRDLETRDRARELRQEMTWPEKKLWYELRDQRLQGFKFRRQQPMGPYIADFVCEQARLVVEIDGESHGGHPARAHDAQRTAWIERQGYKVVRFTNDHVLRDCESVLRSLLHMVRVRVGIQPKTPHPDPLPLGEGGRAPHPDPLPLGEGGRAPHPDPLPLGEGGRRPILTALVPNEKGFERAAALHDRAGGFPLKIAVFTAASETFSKKNTNATIAESFERFGAFLPRAFALGMPVRMYVSCAVSCPFEGPIAPGQVRRVVDGLRALVPRGERAEIDLGDTIGAAEPAHIDALLGVFDADERAALTLHLHDTFGRAAACVHRALELGVRSFDGSVAGLGGCPYASTREKPAPGNIATETLVRTVHDAGFATGVDPDALAEAAAFARRIVAEARERHEADAPTGPRREGGGA